jgi:hypothetical protein
LHPHCYLSGLTQVDFVGTLLSSTTSTWFAPLLERQSPLLNNFETFVEKFCAIFEILNKEWTSTNNLQFVHQDLAPTIVYTFKFKQSTCDILWDAIVLMS